MAHCIPQTYKYYCQFKLKVKKSVKEGWLKESASVSKDTWKFLPKSFPSWFKHFFTCPPAVKKEQLLIITHIISFHTQWKPRKQPHSQMPVKGSSLGNHSWPLSVISLNLKTIIKSLFRLHYSRLNKPNPLDFHHKADFSNFLIISVGFLWILSNSTQWRHDQGFRRKGEIV